MSIQAMVWVLDESESTLADRLVLLAIANHCDARGVNAWPSVETIAAEARVNRATVFRAIEALERAGELTVTRRPGTSSYYGITGLMKGSQIATGRGSQIATGGVASCDSGGRKLRPKPSVTVNEPRTRDASLGKPTAEPTRPALAVEDLADLPERQVDFDAATGLAHLKVLRGGAA